MPRKYCIKIIEAKTRFAETYNRVWGTASSWTFDPMLNYFLIDFLFLARKSCKLQIWEKLMFMRVKAKRCQKTKIYVSSFLSLSTLFVVENIIGALGAELGPISCSWVSKAMFTLSYYCVFCHVSANLLFYSSFIGKFALDSVHKALQNTYFPSISRFFSIWFRNLLTKLHHEMKSQGDEGKANVILPQVISILIRKKLKLWTCCCIFFLLHPFNLWYEWRFYLKDSLRKLHDMLFGTKSDVIQSVQGHAYKIFFKLNSFTFVLEFRIIAMVLET